MARFLKSELDTAIGARIRLRRSTLGLTQADLGERLGMSFQQVQKYERGNNRVSAGCLLQLAQILDVPVTFFYDGLGAPESHIQADDHDAEILLRAYHALPDDQRPVARDLLRTLVRHANSAAAATLAAE